MFPDPAPEAHKSGPGTLPFDTQLAWLVRYSRYAERVLNAEPARATWLRTVAHLAATESIRQSAADLLGTEPHTLADTATLDHRLRALRTRAMLAILFRDLNRLADLDEVVSAVSLLANTVVDAAVSFHRQALAREWNVPIDGHGANEADFVVVGMGKLGADELNVSSDIDLVFVYPRDGDATATRSWHEFHATLGKRVIKSLDEVTADGFVFRVDMRLRPFGASGPLVASLATLADYFMTQARPWERYAWLKARAITGTPQHIKALDELVRPFVYRRYHDFAAIGEMRGLHQQIREEAGKRGKQDDIKVGAGGIREAEFVVQLPQLVRGGRDPALQLRGTRAAMEALAAAGLMPPPTQEALMAAYVALRDVEHRLQYRDDQQTQALPTQEADRALLAEAMGAADWPAFTAHLDQHRHTVRSAFEAAFGGVGGTDENHAKIKTPVSTAVFSQNALETPVDASVSRLGSSNIGPQRQARDDAMLKAPPAARPPHPSLQAFHDRVALYLASTRAKSLPERSLKRITRLMTRVAEVLPHDGHNNARTAIRLLDIVEAVDRRETYLALLEEYPQVLPRLAHIAANSAWAADLFRRHPILLDDLTRPPQQQRIDWATERARLTALCDAAQGDVERQYEILRHTKQQLTLRAGIDDLEGRASVMSLSDELSALADMLVEETTRRAWQQLYPDETLDGFAVIAYGKWGSKELGYQSDLDLVFVTDENAPTAKAHPERFARLAQRVMSWLNTMTSGGVLYETDVRLRPDGAAGLLVTTLEAFADYQQNRAWTWEHQALTRARGAAGDATVIAAFERIRLDVLTTPRNHAALKADIVEMRQKMRQEKKDRADSLDLKNTVGGVVDIEFIVQFWILAWSGTHAEFTQNLGNFALITRAGALGLIDEDDAAALGKAYLAFRARLHDAQLNDEHGDRKAWIAVDELLSERRAVERVWRAVLG